MSSASRTILTVGLFIGLVLVIGIGVWWQQGPSESDVRRTVVTTVQEEAPSSFLVTGTLQIAVTVEIDSAEYATPDWLTFLLSHSQPSALPFLEGRSKTRVRVPGRVSYGFNVETLTPEMIAVEEDGVVAVDLPDLSVHSVEPDLARLRIRTSSEGWMRVFPSRVPEDVRQQALSGVRSAFARQAEQRIVSASQPRINTARALEKMLRAPLQASGLRNPRFRIRVGERLTITPEEKDERNFQK